MYIYHKIHNHRCDLSWESSTIVRIKRVKEPDPGLRLPP